MILIPLQKKSLDFVKEPLIFSEDYIQMKRWALKAPRNSVVMERWETPMLQRHIDLLDVKDKDVLEIGFGMGITAGMIQKAEPKSHTIIECHPQVINHAKSTFPYIDKVNLVANFWQNVIMGMGKFDRIFFDPHMDDYDAFFQIVDIKLREDGIFSYFHWENFHRAESFYNVKRHPFEITRNFVDGGQKDIIVQIPIYQKSPGSSFLKS
jgi:spermidine synthase